MSSYAMSGETKSDISGWTTDTLKDYFDKVFEERDKRFEQRFEAQKEAVRDALKSAALAVDKAESNAERWRQNANEWRGTLSDRDRMLMPRAESEKSFEALNDKIAAITKVCVASIFLGIAVITVILLIVRH